MVGTVYFDKYVSPEAKLTEGVSIDDYSTGRKGTWFFFQGVGAAMGS